jgi:hypothetical protein
MRAPLVLADCIEAASATMPVTTAPAALLPPPPPVVVVGVLGEVGPFEVESLPHADRNTTNAHRLHPNRHRRTIAVLRCALTRRMSQKHANRSPLVKNDNSATYVGERWRKPWRDDVFCR